MICRRRAGAGSRVRPLAGSLLPIDLVVLCDKSFLFSRRKRDETRKHLLHLAGKKGPLISHRGKTSEI